MNLMNSINKYISAIFIQKDRDSGVISNEAMNNLSNKCFLSGHLQSRSL